MPQAQSVVVTCMMEWSEGCLVPCFAPFPPPTVFPKLSLSCSVGGLQQLTKQNLRQTDMINIRLAVLCVPATIYHHLGHDGRVTMVHCLLFTCFLTVVCPNCPSSTLSSLATCQTKSAPKTHNQCKIVMSKCSNYNLSQHHLWNDGKVRMVPSMSPVLLIFDSCAPKFTQFCTLVSGNLPNKICTEHPQPNRYLQLLSAPSTIHCHFWCDGRARKVP